MVSGGQTNNKGSANRPHSVAYDLDHSAQDSSGGERTSFVGKIS